MVRQTKTDIDYIRPLAYYGLGEPGKIVLNPAKFKVNVAVAAAKMGTYMGKEQMEKGANIIDLLVGEAIQQVDFAPGQICGNYVNSVIAKIESNQHRADEALMLNSNGTVAEGRRKDMFIVRGGRARHPVHGLRGTGKRVTKDSDRRQSPRPFRLRS